MDEKLKQRINLLLATMVGEDGQPLSDEAKDGMRTQIAERLAKLDQIKPTLVDPNLEFSEHAEQMRAAQAKLADDLRPVFGEALYQKNRRQSFPFIDHAAGKAVQSVSDPRNADARDADGTLKPNQAWLNEEMLVGMLKTTEPRGYATKETKESYPRLNIMPEALPELSAEALLLRARPGEAYVMKQPEFEYLTALSDEHGKKSPQLAADVQRKMTQLERIKVSYLNGKDGEIDRAKLETDLQAVFGDAKCGQQGRDVDAKEPYAGQLYAKYVADLMLGKDLPDGKKFKGAIADGIIKIDPRDNELDSGWINLDVIDKLTYSAAGKSLHLPEKDAARYVGKVQGTVFIPEFGKVEIETPAGHERMKEFASEPTRTGYGAQLNSVDASGSFATPGFPDSDSKGAKEPPDLFFPANGYDPKTTKIFAIDQLKKKETVDINGTKKTEMVYDEPKMVMAGSAEEALQSYAQTWSKKEQALQQVGGVLEFDSPEKYQAWLQKHASASDKAEPIGQLQNRTGEAYGHYFSREPKVAAQNVDVKAFKDQKDFQFLDEKNEVGFDLKVKPNAQGVGELAAGNRAASETLANVASVNDRAVQTFAPVAAAAAASPLVFKETPKEPKASGTLTFKQAPEEQAKHNPAPRSTHKAKGHGLIAEINAGEVLALGDGMGGHKDTHDIVEDAQKKIQGLTGKKIGKDGADGKYGHDTETAVQAWQKDFNQKHHLAGKNAIFEDGRYGGQTSIAVEISELEKKLKEFGKLDQKEQTIIAKEVNDVVQAVNLDKGGKPHIPKELLKTVHAFADTLTKAAAGQPAAPAFRAAVANIEKIER